MNADVEVSIGFVNTSVGPDSYVSISITDKKSRVSVAEIHMSDEEFANVVFRNRVGEGKATFSGFDLIGKRREVKREEVLIADGEKLFCAALTEEARNRVADEVLKPYCVDGWRPSNKGYLFNSHRRKRFGSHGYIVLMSFMRYVDGGDDGE